MHKTLQATHEHNAENMNKIQEILTILKIAKCLLTLVTTTDCNHVTLKCDPACAMSNSIAITGPVWSDDN